MPAQPGENPAQGDEAIVAGSPVRRSSVIRVVRLATPEHPEEVRVKRQHRSHATTPGSGGAAPTTPSIIFSPGSPTARFPDDVKPTPVDAPKEVLVGEIWGSIDRLKHRASAGSSAACNELGLCMLLGLKGVNVPDYVSAFTWFERATATPGASGDAHANLGICYERGQGTPVNFEAAVNQYRLGADKKSYTARHHLAMCLSAGRGAPQDKSAAFLLFKEAAVKLAPSKTAAGLALLTGQGVSLDAAAAVAYFRAAAKQGDAQGMRLFSEALRDGVGVKKNEAQALRWRRAAARAGDKIAQAELAQAGEDDVDTGGCVVA